ncbi:DUF7002 family protein [Jannaschia seohaensis]|uniref:Uncharacterized protein n=1 Tax=Jannaschia seohaensis TaxID=475081 RepID=A0A2Y9A3L4_9RHOB|nr:hypothetical protein [Jannaschia seohaensis]PWJ22168.1 hypothetical protein BCF38_101578 [Jannaschia seohaensis]SSA38446.1 hypothetical protein SAMN05421539_101578 [Jannaschia seohaensis]
MTPEAFAARHPRLWRLSSVGSLEGIRRHGLLCARSLAARAGHDLADAPRPEALALRLPCGAPVRITDNSPLSAAKLARVLDDGLTVADWMAMLNARVFFWPERSLGTGNRDARARLGYRSEWHVFDTLRLLAPVWDRAEIAPFNTGATIHQPPRRGRASFAPLGGLDYETWRRTRRAQGAVKGLDTVKEVTVRGDLPHAADALTEIARA